MEPKAIPIVLMGAADRFSKLPAHEQERYRRVNQGRVEFARDHAIPIIFAPPLSMGGEVNGGTGFALQLGSGSFVVTASHVLAGYEGRLQKGEVLNWQVGNLPPFDSLSRVAYRDFQRDIVLLRLASEEVSHLRSHDVIISAPTQWPPRVPHEQQLVLVAGYPMLQREVDPLGGKIGAGPYSAMLPASNVGEGYFSCQIDHKDLVSFNGGPLPEPGTFLGGLSGGPVLLVERGYPLVGVIIQSLDKWGLLRIAALDGIDEKDFH
jgi:hypothetical protein